LLISSSSSWAWGPRFEPMKAAFSRGNPLEARDDHHDHEEAVVIEAYRSKLENIYDTSYGHALDSFAFLREKADALASETFAESFDADFECEIPTDWKTSQGDIEEVDVMKFLGIQRAEPLRASLPIWINPVDGDLSLF
jgi:hypothetical protein